MRGRFDVSCINKGRSSHIISMERAQDSLHIINMERAQDSCKNLGQWIQEGQIIAFLQLCSHAWVFEQ